VGVVDLRLSRPFVISAGAATTERTLVVELSHDGLVGLGEASPSARVCGETLDDASRFLDGVAARIARGELSDPVALLSWVDKQTGTPAARCAVETAVADLLGKQRKKSVAQLLNLQPARLPTSATVSLGLPEAMAKQSVEYVERGFRVLKVKVGEAARDVERVAAIRDACPEAAIRCDANGGWSEAEAVRVTSALEKLEIELLEQPLARGSEAAIRRLAGWTDVPIFLDESVLSFADAQQAVADRVADGINVKLMKTGGLHEALRIARHARAHDWPLMIGCMIETSVGITAASHLLAAFDHADLDGAFLTANDPFEGATLRDGFVAPPPGPGLGVRPKP